MIADVLINKKLNPVVAELFIGGRKLIISLFYQTILFWSTKKYKKNLYTPFYYQARTCI